MTRATETLGFLGAGHLASYTIAALRNGGHDGQILVSPRNRDTAEQLAQDHDCVIAQSNQDLANHATILVLSVRPQQLSAALDGLLIPDISVVLSAVAGVSLTSLRKFANMPAEICRFMPSSFIDAGDAVFPVNGDTTRIAPVFQSCGRVMVFETEEQFELSTLASCSYAWSYALMDALTQWFEDQGLAPGFARELVVRHLRGATTYALANPDEALPSILSRTATPGTYTQLGLDRLMSTDALAPWTAALNAVHKELTKPDETDH
jgi:pyrroline-5-carboxylate reductase